MISDNISIHYIYLLYIIYTVYTHTHICSITCLPVRIQLEVGKLDSFTVRKYTEKVRMERDLERMSWGKVEENRNVNPRGKI